MISDLWYKNGAGPRTNAGLVSAVASTPMHRLIFEQIVPGALLDFDLPDLAGALARRGVWPDGRATSLGRLLKKPKSLRHRIKSSGINETGTCA